MAYYCIFLLLPAFFALSHGSCGAAPRLDFAELNPLYVDQDNFAVNATANYTCRLGYIRVPGTQNFITCLSNSSWSTPAEFCTRRSCGNPGDIVNGKVSITDTLFGSRVNYSCDPGYTMASKRNYRDCQADGTWSNEVPVCEVQVCQAPNAITDGSYSPDKEEYQYQDAVTYTCNDKKFSLIGEKTLSCTEYGNWSADPPQCKDVECTSPTVDNSEKLSGFSGPYVLNSAISYRCLQGFTMVGPSVITCNASSQWAPSVPSCISTVTQKPATTKDKELGIGGGNNVGAIVGNTLIIVTMSFMALINNGF